MSETLPAQIETDSNMTFIAAKPATARHLSSQLGLRAVVGFDAFGRERMGVIADRFDRLDDPRGVDLVVAPIDGEPALGEVEPGIDHARQFGQAAFDLADAPGAGDAVHRKRHMRRAGSTRLNEQRKVNSLGHRRRSLDYDAIFGSEQPIALA